MFFNIAKTILAITVCLGAAAAMASSTKVIHDSCTVVATVFGEDICHEDIYVEKEHIDAIRAEFEQQGLDSEQALEDRSQERLKEMIWSVALEKKFGTGALEPDEAEIAVFSKALKGTLDEGHLKNVETAAKIEAMLAGDEYSEVDKEKLRKLLDSIKTSIAFYEERESYKEGMPPEFHAMLAQAQKGLAGRMVRSWKINKALYKEYGGRVVSRNNEIVPAEAYGAFVNYIRETGQLEIKDERFADVFKETELFAATADKQPDGIPPTIAEEDRADFYDHYFSTIQWQFAHGMMPTAGP